MENKPIRIPLTQREKEVIKKKAKNKYLSVSTYLRTEIIPALEIFEKENSKEINMSFTNTNIISKESYITIYIDMGVYEKIKRLSEVTSITVPFICRYLIIPRIKAEE